MIILPFTESVLFVVKAALAVKVTLCAWACVQFSSVVHAGAKSHAIILGSFDLKAYSGILQTVAILKFLSFTAKTGEVEASQKGLHNGVLFSP
jgi:hypothetical protein